MKVFDGKSYLNGDILHLGSITAYPSDSLYNFVHGIYLPVIAKLPVPEVENKLFRYLTKIEQLFILTMTATLLLLEELGELVDITDTVLPRAHANLTRVVSVDESLFGELDEVYTVISTESLVIARDKRFL